MDSGAVFAAIALVFLLAGLLPFVRGKSRQASLDLLRSELAIERDARQEQDKRCTAEIAELRGQLKTLTHDFAAIIARQVATEVVDVMRADGIIK